MMANVVLQIAPSRTTAINGNSSRGSVARPHLRRLFSARSTVQSSDNATLTEASMADFSMYPMALGLAATAFLTEAESASCFGGTPRPVKRIRDQIALTCALSRPVAFL